MKRMYKKIVLNPVAKQSRTFLGVIQEIPYISVDYFVNVKTTLALFLSHCHADHMEGLGSHDFYQFVQNRPGVFVYCSSVTKQLLSSWEDYSKLSPYLKVLEINQTIILNFSVPNENGLSHQKSICVTLIPNGHCPGSVMFLFEGLFGTVLYTGDFRIAKGDSRKFQALMANPSRPDYGLKTIDHIYLDCTFCCDNAKTFPSREQSVIATINLISDWMAKGSDHIVLLLLAGKGFGAEFIFVEVYGKLKVKVHTSQFKRAVYKNIPEIQNAITSNTESSIHACIENNLSARKQNSICFKDSHKVLKIRLTTQWHLLPGKNTESQTVVKEEDIYRILYSMHSSLDEIQDLVNSLKPRQITPIAKPDKISLEEISQLLGVCVAITSSLPGSPQKRRRSSSPLPSK